MDNASSLHDETLIASDLLTSELSGLPSSPPELSPEHSPEQSPSHWSVSATFPPPTSTCSTCSCRKRRDSFEYLDSVKDTKRRRLEPINNEKLRKTLRLWAGFKWNILDFLDALLKENAATDWTVSRVPRLELIAFKKFAYSKIPEEHDVFKFFDNKVPESTRKWAMEIIGRDMHKEIGDLTRLPAFGQHDDKNAHPNEYDGSLSLSSDHLIQSAPSLLMLLDGLTSKSWYPKSVSVLEEEQKEVMRKFQFLLSTICSMRFPMKSTNLPCRLAIYLYSGGTTRAALDLLSKVHICSSYKVMSRKLHSLQERALTDVRKLGTKDNSVVTYDNFEFREGKRGERVGDQARFRSITTALVIPSRLDGHPPLTKSMWRPRDYLLRVEDIMEQSIKSPLDKEMALYHVQSCLQSITDKAQVRWPIKEPSIRRLPCYKTVARPLEPIMKDENSNENNISILEDIYRRQLGLKESSATFADHLRVTSGDQKTWARMVSAHAIRVGTATKRADSLAWNVPILGLWHYKYNLVQLLHSTHWGAPSHEKSKEKMPKNRTSEQHNEDGDIRMTDTLDPQLETRQSDVVDASSLQFAADRWGRTRVVDPSNFQAVEELLIHSYRSRVIAVLLHQLKEAGRPIRDGEDLSEWLQSCTESQLQQAFEFIVEELHERAAALGAQDQLFQNHRHFCVNVEVYLTLKYAIKYADIGLLRYILPYTTAMFHDKQGHKTNYATASLYMLHLFNSKASDLVLQDFVMANSIVNIQGRVDSNFELDRLLEMHNGLLRAFLKERTSFGNADADTMLRRWALISPYLDELKSWFHKTCLAKIDGSHAIKPSIDDVLTMAWRLYHNGEMCEQSVPRSSDFPAVNLVISGQQSLFAGDTVWTYNERYEHFEDATLDDEQLMDGELEDAAADKPIVTISESQTLVDYDIDGELQATQILGDDDSFI